MEGYKVYRHDNNPEEKKFHDAFSKISLSTASSYALPVDENRCLTDEEHKIQISTIQWLGSPVGQNFLREMGYEKVVSKMTNKDRKSIVISCKKENSNWSSLIEYEQDTLISKECRKRGFTFPEFFLNNSDFIKTLL